MLFANAGIAKFAPVRDVSEEVYDETSDLNAKGVFFTLQKALPCLNDNASVIVNTSFVDHAGVPSTNVYAASKICRKYLVASPTQTFRQPEEVAQTELFLTSSASSYIAGVVLNVHGGLGQV